MDWKQEAMEKLRQYGARQAALKDIPDDIAMLEAQAQRIRRGSFDDTHVKSGGAVADDQLINNIVRREELKIAMEQAQIWVSRVERGLSVLDADEQLVLKMLYIQPAKGNIDRLCGELCVEQATVYRKRDKALRRFTLALYGCMET